MKFPKMEEKHWNYKKNHIKFQIMREKSTLDVTTTAAVKCSIDEYINQQQQEGITYQKRC